MLKRFTTKELVFIALMSAFMFVGDFVLGIAVVAATGIPLSGGIVSLVFLSFIFVTILLTVRKFGVTTIVSLIYTVLAIPTASFGSPGVYKPIIGIVLGLFVDAILLLGRYRKIAYYLGIFFGFMIVAPVMWGVLVLLKLPGAAELGEMVFLLMIIQGIEGLIGTWLAMIVYEKKFKKNKLVRMIQG